MKALFAIATSIGLTCCNGVGTSDTPERIRCYEDEVVVWTGDAHDACVTLDDMFVDPETGTIHWYEEDERR